MRAQVPLIRPLREELHGATRDLARGCGTEPLDRDALEGALARVRRARDAYQAFMYTRLLDIVEKLPPEQRVAVLREALQRRAGRGGPPRGPKHQ